MSATIPRCLRASKTVNQRISTSGSICHNLISSRQFTCTPTRCNPDKPSPFDSVATPRPQNTQTPPISIPTRPSPPTTNYTPPPFKNTTAELTALFDKNQDRRTAQRGGPGAFRRSSFPGLNIENVSSTGLPPVGGYETKEVVRPHHLHVFAHKHNCHITLTTPDRNPIISVSNGNIGFRKAGRKHFDSAFQLASYVLGRIREEGLNTKIMQLEISLRGFGAGREAVTKALLGTEGRLLRGKIVKIMDATRLKFGGTRSKAPRRLG